LLDRLDASARLIGVDQDPVVLEVARVRLEAHDARVRLYHGNFAELDRVLAAEGVSAVDGILLDLGLNSFTLARPEAGQSYLVDVPLDMAIDPGVRENAARLLARLPERELADALFELGGLRRARLYARRIVDARRRSPIVTTGGLVRAVMPQGRPHPAELSRIFQAIRVLVLEEVPRLERFLAHVADWVVPGGRVVIIDYASHEDRRVKAALHRHPEFRPLYKKPVVPSRTEVAANRRARSAKLRAYERRG
jgi:16S rRNA (cytosine1402-N4)-methyltransferase